MPKSRSAKHLYKPFWENQHNILIVIIKPKVQLANYYACVSCHKITFLLSRTLPFTITFLQYHYLIAACMKSVDSGFSKLFK